MYVQHRPSDTNADDGQRQPNQFNIGGVKVLGDIR